jgi:DNA-binding protein YbaB
MFGPEGLDFTDVLSATRERMAKVEAVKGRLSELTGQAETADGRIKVVSTSDDPLAELHIDPRALRMGTEALAAAIKATARQARGDLDRQVREITAAEFGGENPMDMLKDKEELSKSMTDMQAMFEKTGRDARSMIEQLQRGLNARQAEPPK